MTFHRQINAGLLSIRIVIGLARTFGYYPHNCDNITYDERGILMRLLYPVMHLRFSYTCVANGKMSDGGIINLLPKPWHPMLFDLRHFFHIVMGYLLFSAVGTLTIVLSSLMCIV